MQSLSQNHRWGNEKLVYSTTLFSPAGLDINFRFQHLRGCSVVVAWRNTCSRTFRYGGKSETYHSRIQQKSTWERAKQNVDPLTTGRAFPDGICGSLSSLAPLMLRVAGWKMDVEGTFRIYPTKLTWWCLRARRKGAKLQGMESCKLCFFVVVLKFYVNFCNPNNGEPV